VTLGVGKLEGRIVVPTGGWSFELTDSSGGPYTISLTAADTYYLSSADSEANGLLADLKSKMDAAGNTYSVNLSDTTGKVTITVDTGTFSVTWTSTDLRDLLGFDSNISAKVTTTGASQCESLWRPSAHCMPDFGLNSPGLVVSNAMVRIAPDGTYSAFHGPSRTRNRLSWPVIPVSQVVEAEETTTNASFERFWIDTVRGEAGWAQAGRLRWYPEETDDATFISYAVTDAISPQYERVDPTYDGLWSVSLVVSEIV